MKATAKDLRFHTKEILEAVLRGEEVIISYRGKSKAKIIPIERSMKEKRAKHDLFGIWKDNASVENVDQFVREIRAGRVQ